MLAVMWKMGPVLLNELMPKRLIFRHLLCRAVHVWPESSKLRRALAVFYLHFGDILTDHRNAETVARCAEIAAGLGRNESSGAEMACLVGIGQTLSRNSKSGLQSAIKIVHMYPGNPEAWSVLVGFGFPPVLPIFVCASYFPKFCLCSVRDCWRCLRAVFI